MDEAVEFDIESRFVAKDDMLKNSIKRNNGINIDDEKLEVITPSSKDSNLVDNRNTSILPNTLN